MRSRRSNRLTVFLGAESCTHVKLNQVRPFNAVGRFRLSLTRRGVARFSSNRDFPSRWFFRNAWPGVTCGQLAGRYGVYLWEPVCCVCMSHPERRLRGCRAVHGRTSFLSVRLFEGTPYKAKAGNHVSGTPSSASGEVTDRWYPFLHLTCHDGLIEAIRFSLSPLRSTLFGADFWGCVHPLLSSSFIISTGPRV